MVGEKAKSLESCWPYLVKKQIKNTPKETPVIGSVGTSAQNLHFAKSSKQAVKVNKVLSGRENSAEAFINISNPLQNTSETLLDTTKPDKISNAAVRLVNNNLHDTSFPEECIDCVINEEVVETSEVDNLVIPCITLTECTDMEVESETGHTDDHVLAADDVLDDSPSDQGYESYDSPISETDNLINLFPELW